MTTMPKARAAIVSIVKYPSSIPFTNGAEAYFSAGIACGSSSRIKPVRQSTAMESSNIGVNSWPIRSTSFEGFKLSQYTRAKKRPVNSHITKDPLSGKNGFAPIS